MTCRCDGSGECMCRPDWRTTTPEQFADMVARIVSENKDALDRLAEGPSAECHESRCKVFPDLCKCRKSPEIAEPGEW